MTLEELKLQFKITTYIIVKVSVYLYCKSWRCDLACMHNITESTYRFGGCMVKSSFNSVIVELYCGSTCNLKRNYIFIFKCVSKVSEERWIMHFMFSLFFLPLFQIHVIPLSTTLYKWYSNNKSTKLKWEYSTKSYSNNRDQQNQKENIWLNESRLSI